MLRGVAAVARLLVANSERSAMLGIMAAEFVSLGLPVRASILVAILTAFVVSALSFFVVPLLSKQPQQPQ